MGLFPNVLITKTNGVITNEYGDKAWYKDGKLHREDGPACEYIFGDKVWYKEGEIHRVDGPAYEYCDGTKVWYKRGKYHRIDGAALEWSDGDKYWYYEGEEIKCKSQEEFERIIRLKMFW